MVIDSGSDLTIVNVKTTQRLNLQFQSLSKWLPNNLGANGFPVKMVGMIPNACIETPKGFLVDNVWVAANLTSEVILGHNSLSAFYALTICYGSTLPALEVHQVTTTDLETKSSFTTHQPVKCFSHLDRSQTPLCAPSQRHSSADRDFIHSEVQQLKAEGKIRPSNSSWQSQAFVVHEIRQKPRMVIDYSQTVNRVTPLDAYPILLVVELVDRISQCHHFSYICCVTLTQLVLCRVYATGSHPTAITMTRD